jgi:peptidoglycan/LPS O-acetylase OafA/YrhL
VKKLEYLESLRGLAALVVVLNHFAIAFYPALYFGTAAVVHTKSGIEAFVSGTPLNLLINGSFSVALFFVLSGFVLTYKFFKDRSQPVHLIPLTVKRYVRLLPPVFMSIVLSYLFMRFSLLSSQPASVLTGSGLLRAYLQFEPNLLTALYESFIGSLLRHDATYNGALWTMTFEFFGSILVFLFVALFRNWNRRYLVYILVLIMFGNRYYSAFIVGMILCDLFTLRPDLFSRKGYRALSLVLLGLGLFLGSYPAIRPVEGTIYAFMKPYAIARSYHMIGAGLVMFALLNLQHLQSVLSRKAFVFLGKISFSLYIIHFLLISSVGCAIFCFVAPHLSYHSAFLVTFLLTMPVIVLASFLTYRFVDAQGVGLSQKAYAFADPWVKQCRRLLERLVPLPIRTHALYRSLVRHAAEDGGSGEETSSPR